MIQDMVFIQAKTSISCITLSYYNSTLTIIYKKTNKTLPDKYPQSTDICILLSGLKL